MKPKVIFIDRVHPILFEKLQQSGYQCEWKTELNRNHILNILKEYEGAVIRSKFKFDTAVFDAAPKLKWIARSGSGMENINLIEAEKRGIRCYNSPEGNKDAVAEHCMGMLLSLFNRLRWADQEVRQGQWNREANRGIELKGKTVGILGYGNMGKAFAERLCGFGVEIIAYDKYKKNFHSERVKEVSLEELKLKTEVLSLHLPLTEETHFLIDDSFIKSFAKPFYLINSARGKILSTKALIEGLKSGKIKGACLDVLEHEQLSFEGLNPGKEEKELKELFQFEQLLLSPHVAGWTDASYEKLSSVLAEKIIASG